VTEDRIRAEYQAAKSADDGERVSLSDLLAEVADVPTADDALEDAADVAAFDVAMAEGENIPWAQVEVCEFGATSAELKGLLADRLPAFQDWMRGQTMGVCPEHGQVVYRSDLERFLAGRPILD